MPIDYLLCYVFHYAHATEDLVSCCPFTIRECYTMLMQQKMPGSYCPFTIREWFTFSVLSMAFSFKLLIGFKCVFVCVCVGFLFSPIMQVCLVILY